jgi:hypothetical protein
MSKKSEYMKMWRKTPQGIAWKTRQMAAALAKRKASPEAAEAYKIYHREYARKARKNPDFRKKHSAAVLRHYSRNKAAIIRRAIESRKNNLSLRIKHNLRERLRAALTGRVKSESSIKIVGCSTEHLMHWLEAQFSVGMTWENYGKWHVDHKKPCASFDLSNPEAQKACFHFSNLQPLWASENLAKGAKRTTIGVW